MPRFAAIAEAARGQRGREVLRATLAAHYALAGGLGLKATILLAPEFIATSHLNRKKEVTAVMEVGATIENHRQGHDGLIFLR